MRGHTSRRRRQAPFKLIVRSLTAAEHGSFALGDSLVHNVLACVGILCSRRRCGLLIVAVFLLELEKQLVVGLGASGLQAKLALVVNAGGLLLRVVLMMDISTSADKEEVSELLSRGLLLSLEVSARGYT